jgi:hypothetical protein
MLWQDMCKNARQKIWRIDEKGPCKYERRLVNAGAGT